MRRRSQPWPAALVVLLLCPPRSLAEPPVPPADPAVTPPAAQQYQFRIPAQRADRALTAFARQAGITLVFCFESARRKQASALVGRHTLD
ncbi:MAG: hypothetical protein ACK53C_13940, partial [Pseudomonadota bacterium]